VFTNVPATIALERAFLAEFRGDAEGTAMFASRALGALAEDEWMLASVARERLAVADWLGGRLPAAEQAMARRVAGFRAAGEATLAAWGGYYLGLVQRAQGRLDAALRTYQEGLEITAPPQANPIVNPGNPSTLTGREAATARISLMLPARERWPYAFLNAHYAQPLATGLATLRIHTPG
jgi:hypothetical protein